MKCDFSDLERMVERKIKFSTFYADPPWRYDNQGTRAAAGNHYETLSVDEIAELPIKELANDEAHLHLWTTNAFLFDCPRIIEAWGFDYKGVFFWGKTQMGIGNYWRVSHEILVLGVRNNLPFMQKDLKSWIELPRGKHSSKPEEIRKIIEKTGLAPRLELFGRRPIFNNGWVVWGNEIEREDFNLMLEGSLDVYKKEEALQTELTSRARRQEGFNTLFE